MAEEFAKLGGVVMFQGAVNVGDTDMTPILTEIASLAPDLIYAPVFQPESDFMWAQKGNISGLEGTTMMGADASLVDGFPEAAGASAVGSYLSGPFVENDAYNALLAACLLSVDMLALLVPSHVVLLVTAQQAKHLLFSKSRKLKLMVTGQLQLLGNPVTKFINVMN